MTYPTKWEICPRCSGNGTTTRHLGGFTASEWAEACDGDPDFEENYFSGAYDRPCDECNGSGKVKVVDTDQLTPEQLEAYRQEQEDRRYELAEREAEMRYCYGRNY